MNRTQQHDLITISSFPPSGPSAQPSHNLPFNQPTTTLEKSSMSFFKRPIRMKRDKKAPPSPLIVPPSSSANPAQTTQASSSHTGTKFNSLLTAAARSIRTGDSRLFESFQAAKSPNALQTQIPYKHPSTQKNINIHSLKRIPVPSYNPLQILPLQKTDVLTRTASLERPKTATKHSRTSSLPDSQAAPNLEPPSNSLWKTRSHQDLTKSPTKTSELEQELVESSDLLPQSYPIHTLSTLSLKSGHPVVQSKSDISQISSPFDSVSFNIDFSAHPHEPVSSTPLSAHRTGPNLSFELSRETASKVSGDSPRNDHHRPLSPSIRRLLRLGSQISLPVSFRASSSNPLSNSYSSSGSGLELNQRSNDFLEPEKKTLSTREAQRRSFQNMPLPALPPLSSPTRCKPSSSALLQLPPSPNSVKYRTTGFLATRKLQRPWSIASPGIRISQDEEEKSFSTCEPSIDRIDLPTSADQSVSNTRRNSPLKISSLNRQNRHSYPSQSFLNASPLERVSDHLNSVYSTSQTDQKPQFVTLPVSDAGSIGQRENEALRLTPSITPPSGNLMFGFRGEVYELDKCQNPTDSDHSIKVLTGLDDRDPQISFSQPSPHPKSTQEFIEHTSKTCNLVGQKDASLIGSLPTSSNSSGASPVPPNKFIPHPSHQPNDQTDSFIKIQPEFEELGEFIELREICLIGNDSLDHPADCPGADTDGLNTARETIVMETSSPPNSGRNCSTETVLESLTVDRGSSEEESSRLLEESIKFESGPEPKIINPDTSLEMAASILGQPVPPISSEIRLGFARIHYLFSDGRSKESVEKDKQDFMSKMLLSIENKIGESLKTLDAATQTDPVEFLTGRNNNNNNPSMFRHSSMVIPKSHNRRMADALKKLVNRNELFDLSKENLPLNLTRHSIQSEQSLVSAYRNYGVSGATEDQQESLRTSGTLVRSPRSDYPTDRPVFMRQRLSEMGVHASQPHAQLNSPLRNNTGESHLGLQTNSSALNESVLDALDKALKAEESFQREKQHLQSVARRQSQTIESLLIDKEVLSLEVSRLTGLVELLARDHNLLNDRIDKAEQAFERFPASSNRASARRSLTPDDTMNYFTAAGERMMVSKDHDDMKDAAHWVKNRSRKRNGGNSTETDDGVMAGDSEHWEDGHEDDGESLCDPEQSSIHFDHQRLSCEFIFKSCKDKFEPIPGAYPLLTPSQACALAKHT